MTDKVYNVNEESKTIALNELFPQTFYYMYNDRSLKFKKILPAGPGRHTLAWNRHLDKLSQKHPHLAKFLKPQIWIGLEARLKNVYSILGEYPQGMLAAMNNDIGFGYVVASDRRYDSNVTSAMPVFAMKEIDDKLERTFEKMRGGYIIRVPTSVSTQSVEIYGDVLGSFGSLDYSKTLETSPALGSVPWGHRHVNAEGFQWFNQLSPALSLSHVLSSLEPPQIGTPVEKCNNYRAVLSVVTGKRLSRYQMYIFFESEDKIDCARSPTLRWNCLSNDKVKEECLLFLSRIHYEDPVQIPIQWQEDCLCVDIGRITPSEIKVPSWIEEARSHPFGSPEYDFNHVYVIAGKGAGKTSFQKSLQAKYTDLIILDSDDYGRAITYVLMGLGAPPLDGELTVVESQSVSRLFQEFLNLAADEKERVESYLETAMYRVLMRTMETRQDVPFALAVFRDLFIKVLKSPIVGGESWGREVHKYVVSKGQNKVVEFTHTIQERKIQAVPTMEYHLVPWWNPELATIGRMRFGPTNDQEMNDQVQLLLALAYKDLTSEYTSKVSQYMLKYIFGLDTFVNMLSNQSDSI